MKRQARMRWPHVCSVVLVGSILFLVAGHCNAAAVETFDSVTSWHPCATIRSTLWHGWYTLVVRLLGFSLFLTVAYAMGWCHRLVWWLAEREASKLLNHAPVTIGSLSLDVVRGRYAASNVVIHAPRHDHYHWSSPIVARIGHVHVEANVVRCLASLWLLGDEIPLELYTVHVSDVQVFVERKDNVYNFLLLDPHVILTPETNETKETDDAVPPTETNCEAETSDTSDAPHHHAMAAHVVAQMVDAVRQAAAAHGGDHPSRVWDTCRHSLAVHLKHWRDTNTTTVVPSTSTSPVSPTNTSTSPTVPHGVSVLKHLTAHWTATTSRAHSVWVPERRQGSKIVYGRMGRVVLLDARIFVRDRTISNATSSTQNARGWNRPIVIDRVVIRPHEFCPARTVSDDHPPQWFDTSASSDPTHASLPALYQPLPQCVDVVLQRLLAEVAKSNTGRLVQTALGEMADVLASASQAAAAAAAAVTPHST